MNWCSRTAFLLTVLIYTVLGLAVYYWMYLSPQKTPIKEIEVPITLSMFEAPQPPPPEPPPPPPVEPPPPPPPVEPPPPPPPPKPKVKPKPKKKKVVKKIKKQEVKKPEVKPPPPPPPKPVAPPPKPKPVVPTYTPQQIATVEQRYLGELSQLLAKHAQNTYPKRAKRRNWESEVTVSFVILASGKIIELEIEKSGKRKVFNQAALDIFRKHLKMTFKAFPKEIKRKRWKIQLPISYTLR